MCMSYRKEISLSEVSAFKLFTLDFEGSLQSAFAPTFKEGLKYPSNRRIRVDNEEASFFAFKIFGEAVAIAHQGRRYWNLVTNKLIVLPVTLYEVIIEGKYHVPSEDIQCLDGYYPAYESKEIIVHDNKEVRNKFYDGILQRYFNLKFAGLSKVEKEAFQFRLPHIKIERN